MSSASSSSTLPVQLHRHPGFAGRPVTPIASVATPFESRAASVDAVSVDVAEVVTSFGDRVVDVAHLGRADHRTRRRARLALGVGLSMIVGGLALFAYEAAQPWAAWAEAAREAAEVGASVPAQPGWGSGGFGLGFAFFGLVPVMAAGVRLRERPEYEYSLGEGPTARMTVDGGGLPSPAHFAVVRNEGGRVALRFSPAMSGSVQIEGESFSLEQLVSASRNDGEAYVFPLHRGSSARIDQGGASVQVRAVDPATLQVGRNPVDAPFWASVGGVGAAAAAALVLLAAIPDDAMSLAWEDEVRDARYARYLLQADQQQTQTMEPTAEPESSETSGGEGQRSGGPEGKMGNPSSSAADKHYTAKRRPGLPPALARNQDLRADASKAGILGIMQAQGGGLLASPWGGAYSAGVDDADIWGNVMGSEPGEAYGTGGLGIVGTGRLGGGSGEGLIGLGNTGLIGHGAGGGDGTGIGRGSGRGKSMGFDGRKQNGPQVFATKPPVVEGFLGKDVIRRVVRSHINEIRGCYNQALTRNPNAEGRVEVNFVILGSGSVASARVVANGLKDPDAGRCIEKAVKRWHFPTPRGGGSAIVTYPFRMGR